MMDMMHMNRSGESEVEKYNNNEFLNTCPHYQLVGDGICDDELNIEECMYDLNDCCKMENDRTLCQNC